MSNIQAFWGEHNIYDVMVWPTLSPNLNIIECVQDYIQAQKDLRKPTSIEDLWLII